MVSLAVIHFNFVWLTGKAVAYIIQCYQYMTMFKSRKGESSAIFYSLTRLDNFNNLNKFEINTEQFIS